ncbi:MAG: hypothetical protein CMP63_01725 [Flavobacteriales bacterium]|nr:hypothetical protein [Flavobacteriales bacterium]|tara:strand:- start:326 stop:1285 length:960 start_codon:yes stop_codon:yes gene_type:complete
MKKYFENDEILAVLWRWKKPLAVVFALSLAGSAIFSSPMFIKPKFKSFARVYPTNLKKYSEESPTEQMIQMLESDAIRDTLCSRFKLDTLYDIDVDEPYYKDLLYKEYSDHVQFKKTKFESVEIEVLSTSPQVAFDMVKSIINLYNTQVKSLQDEKLVEAVGTVKKMLEQKKVEMNLLESKLNVLRREFGILDYGSQVKNLSKEYYKLLARSNVDPNKIAKVKVELDNLKLKGVEYENLSGRLWSVRNSYNNFKLKYEEHVKELNRKKEYAMKIVNPYKADKKTYPVRWLIVLVSVAIAMSGALGVISFLDRFERKKIT